MRFWRKRAGWPEKSRENAAWVVRHSNLIIRKIEEGTRYLLFANGAVLVAIIGGLPALWKEPALQHLLAWVITVLTVLGLPFAMIAWVFSVPLIQNLVALREGIAERGYISETWQRYRTLKRVFRTFLSFAFFSAVALVLVANFAKDALQGALTAH